MKISEMQVTPIHPERWGDDLDVVNAARVSFNKEVSRGDYPLLPHQDTLVIADKEVKLINYLAKHKHFSPFNHSFLSFRVKAPIFVARQLVKHKFLPWNEVSRRYVDEEPEFYIPELRKRGENVKQGSSDELIEEPEVWTSAGKEHVSYLLHYYQSLLDNGVAPEVARAFLPQNMQSEWIWSGTLGAFLDMLVLRLDPHTQKESRDVAGLIAVHVEKYFPVSYNARINQ